MTIIKRSTIALKFSNLDNLLFVYGTLRPDYKTDNIRYLKSRLKPISTAVTPGKMRLHKTISNAYIPYMLPESYYMNVVNSSKYKVFGWVVELASANDWKMFDEYEGVNTDLYKREKIKVLADNKEMEVWAYVTDSYGSNDIESITGDFVMDVTFLTTSKE